MNKRKKLLIVVIALMLVLLIAMALGYTYAKYVGHKDVSSSTATASWSFDGAISNTEDLETTSISLAQNATNGQVKTERIAPGTSGNFKIIIDASGSEVGVDYDVTLLGEENNKPDNLYFTCSDLINANENGELKKYYSLEEMLAQVQIDENTSKYNLSGTIDKEQVDSLKEITVNWEWPYESTRTGYTLEQLDALDTEDSGITDYTFTLRILGRQAE